MTAETEDEYRRLLYVAMTRAADRLVVGGCKPGNRNEVRENSWYDLIRKGLDASELAVETLDTRHGPVRRYVRPGDQHGPASAAPAAVATDHPLPAWLRVSRPRVPVDAVLLRPSDTSDEGHETRRGEAPAERRRALLRGVLVHRLLQSLPDVAPERRSDTALRFLARNAPDWDAAQRDQLAADVIALIAAKRFAPVFGPGSRAEVAVAGRLARGSRTPALVSGKIDRLVVTAAEILIVDFKTNHAPPDTLSRVPPTYLRQLALYRAVLARLHQDKPVRAALLWTEAADIMEIPAAVLDAELLRILGP